MATMSIPFNSNVAFKSQWTTQRVTDEAVPTFKFTKTPEVKHDTVSVDYSLPSGAKITSAKIVTNMTSPNTGAAIKNVNGNTFTKTDEGFVADVTLSGNTGTFDATFNFKPNGNLRKAGTGQANITFSDIYLVIEYEDDESQEDALNDAMDDSAIDISAGGSGLATQFRPPPQSTCIYDQETGTVYMFDGVTKIQHNLTMKIEEEPTKHKEEYVNNAKNDPDKVTLDVIMSDVYSGKDAISNARSFAEMEDGVLKRSAYDATVGSLLVRNSGEAWPRSENAFYVLHDLKEARKKLSVVTPQYIYTDMIIASVTVNQDADHPFGWEGQIVFQHVFDAKKNQTNNSTGKTSKEKPSAAANIGTTAVKWVADAANKAMNNKTNTDK